MNQDCPDDVRIIARLFIGGKKVAEENCRARDIPRIAELHARAVFKARKASPGAVHMVEIEFLDYPVEDRFLRFGTDQRGMVEPVTVPWAKPKRSAR